ncbi:hypothetical protein GsuE55_23450 [Geobacillus subterraneus]|uniref:Uncharacterized protein n=1 Tax=Geobacillus subterraneus TaxID=129338 RepID=A0A679FLQ3_9BACL|nr:hypothetical protein GsuE55_23450 [Geobacillus subterraneus]
MAKGDVADRFHFIIAHDMFHFRKGGGGIDRLSALDRRFSGNAGTFSRRNNRQQQHSARKQPVPDRQALAGDRVVLAKYALHVIPEFDSH